MNTSKAEKTIKDLFIGNCWEYLRDNFHKFTDTNKIKIALELAKKSIPTELEHSGQIVFNQMTTIVVQEKPLELNFGEQYRAARDTVNTG